MNRVKNKTEPHEKSLSVKKERKKDSQNLRKEKKVITAIEKSNNDSNVQR